MNIFDPIISGSLLVTGESTLKSNLHVTGAVEITGSLIINGTSYTSQTSGTAGTSGSSGSSGTSGTSGSSGSSGTSGTSGSDGSSGTSGTSGTSGSSGTAGTSGTSGTSGSSGDSLFAKTGSFWATTNNVEISGSLAISSSATNFKIEGNQFSQSYLSSNGAIVLNPGYGELKWLVIIENYD
jgi:hypothetical protein